jgi:hypothetical protein
MVIDAESIQHLIDFLHSILKQENSEAVEVCYSCFSTLQRLEFENLFKIVDGVHKLIPATTVRFFDSHLVVAREQKQNLNTTMQEMPFHISAYLTGLYCASSVYKEGLNDSLTHAYLVSLALHYKLDFTAQPVFEIVQISLDSGVYSFVLINRDRHSSLDRPFEWGSDCYVIDSYHQWFGYWADSLTETSEDTYCLKDLILHAHDKLSVVVGNDLNLNSLLQFSSDSSHFLHQHVKSTRNILQEYIISQLGCFLQSLSLPELLLTNTIEKEMVQLLIDADQSSSAYLM